MKRIEDRIFELETATVETKEHRLLHISEGEDAEAVIARDRKATGFTGDYRVIIHHICGRPLAGLRGRHALGEARWHG